jgi:hypothetical protein
LVRVIGHIFEDLPERTNPQWLLSRMWLPLCLVML